MRRRLLTESQLQNARETYAKGGVPLRVLAAQYGVTISTMHYAVRPADSAPKQMPAWVRQVMERLERIERKLK